MTTPIVRVVLLGAGVLFGAAADGQAQTGLERATVERLDAAIEAARAAIGAPGMSVAIGRGGDVVYSRGFGSADVENGVPVGPATVYRTASVSKPFTAAAVLQLVERGSLDLDGSIRSYLPSLPPPYDAVTLRDLLRHTGGVRHYSDDTEFVSTRYCATLEESLSIFAADPLDHAPGQKITYSSYGYTLLGLAIERAAGRSYDDYMREHVFGPARMSSTRLDDLRIIPHRARGYEVDGDAALRNARPLDSSCRTPAGGHVSTAADIVRFVIALVDGRLLDASTFRQMTRSHLTPEIIERTLAGLEIPEGYQPPGLGFGWAILPGTGAVFHGGNQPGFSSVLYFDPATGVTLGIMTNLEGQGDALTGLAVQLAGVLAPVD